MLTLLLACAGCAPGQGERCNPLEISDPPSQGNCPTGFSCVYPTAPNCGVAYCCKVDSSGKVVDTDPNCQPDTTLATTCAVDFAVPIDGGSSD
jgi:hypothetical protein